MKPHMGDLGQDTAVEALGPGHYRGRVSRDWNLWGPVGGYLAGIALRAAGAHTRMAWPASLSCHYLAPARFDRVDVAVTTLRRSRRAESMRVVLTQQGSPILDALVWTVADGLAGPEQNWRPGPTVPAPEAIAPFDPEKEIGADRVTAATYWRSVEIRQIFLPGEVREAGGEPLLRSWDRYVPTASFGDPWIDACRELISIDVAVYPAAAKAFPTHTFVAPSLDLYVAFHTPPPVDDYLLVESRGSAARSGLVSGEVRVWSMAGTLAATGTSQLLCRVL
jgi:acyl-CoA thioesterase